MKLGVGELWLTVDMEDGHEPIRVLPSSETSNVRYGESKTYRWKDGGKNYRVQLQVRDA